MTAIDEAEVEALVTRVLGYMTGGALTFGIWLGDELGLYAAMAGSGPITADAIAEATLCNARLVREWLDGQAAGGIVTYDPATDRYGLSPEAALVVADDTSLVFVARAMNSIASFFIDGEKIASAFRGDGGLAWDAHHPRHFQGTEWSFRMGYRAYLPSWLAAFDGIEAKLEAGGRVADVGCGHGASVIALAEAYPDARITGLDFHGASIEVARARAREAGIETRVEFEVVGALDYLGSYDLICFFDCLHDMGDPVGVARHALEHLDAEGAVLLVEPFALDDRARNLSENPIAALFYTGSAAVCTPASLAQEVKRGLGAQAGEARIRAVTEEAGFTRFRKVAQSPFNLVFEVRP